MGSVTIAWESGTIECPDIMYMVTTFNCGSCSSVIKTTISSITCENLVADQECNVSVQSVLECGAFSDPATLTGICPLHAYTEMRYIYMKLVDWVTE